MTDEATSPLRQRMIDDMTIRKLTPKTQHDYVQRVKNFATFLGRSPDTASFEDVRRYQLHLVASGAGVPTLNQSVSTLRFFFRIVSSMSSSRRLGAGLTSYAILIRWSVVLPMAETIATTRLPRPCRSARLRATERIFAGVSRQAPPDFCTIMGWLRIYPR